MGDHLFLDTRLPPGVTTGTTSNKQELVNILWTSGGMRSFAPYHREVCVDRAEPVPLAPPADTHSGPALAVERLIFKLEFFTLGKEEWVCVMCNGVVVVPPFEFIGWEYLPSHPW